MKTSDFDYNLPLERIAQVPVEPRDASRLLVLNRRDGNLQHSHFYEIGNFLKSNDILVLNQTRVIPARIFAQKATGGKAEILLLKQQGPTRWEALIGGKHIRLNSELKLQNGLWATIVQEKDGARRVLEFSQPIESFLIQHGNMPLPPYIHTPLHDPERYQTIYAKTPGSAAAPTAGLHFTESLLQRLSQAGVRTARVTLHVGLDTFQPVNEALVEDHIIHSEWCELDAENACAINQAVQAGGRIIAVGTTSVRTLETAAQAATSPCRVTAFSDFTRLFIYPGYPFKAVDAMITNFHLPKSSLIMLVSAFCSREHILSAYRTAIQEEYRFYSFGDAMLIQ